MATEQLLLTNDDINEYGYVSKQFNSKDFDTYVLRVQRRNLRGLLGRALYKDFLDNISDEKYQNLLNGVEYSDSSDLIDYYGLKAYISYYVLASMIALNTNNINDLGNVSAVGNSFNLSSAQELKMARDEYLNNAVSIGNDIKAFLDENTTIYPLWESSKIEDVNQFSLGTII